MLLCELQAFGTGTAKVQADAARAGVLHEFVVGLKARIKNDNARRENRFASFHDHRETPWNLWERMRTNESDE